MAELPIPQSLQRAIHELDTGQKQGFIEGGIVVSQVPVQDYDLGQYWARCVFNRSNINVQFFRKDDGSFPMSFRGRIFKAFRVWRGPHNGIDITWEDDVNSWCVTVKDGAITPPGKDDITEVLKMVVS